MMKLLYDNIFLPLVELINTQKKDKKSSKNSESQKDLLKSNDKFKKSQREKPSKSEEAERLHKIVQSKMNDQMLGRKEAAEFLGVKENTLAIWKLTNRQIIPTYKIGKFIKYKASDLQKFLDGKLI